MHFVFHLLPDFFGGGEIIFAFPFFFFLKIMSSQACIIGVLRKLKCDAVRNTEK